MASDKQDPAWTSPSHQVSEPEAETISFEREKTVSLREQTSQMEAMTCGLRDYRQVARHQRRVSSAYAEGKDRIGRSERLQFFMSERRKREAARRGNGEKETPTDRDSPPGKWEGGPRFPGAQMGRATGSSQREGERGHGAVRGARRKDPWTVHSAAPSLGLTGPALSAVTVPP